MKKTKRGQKHNVNKHKTKKGEFFTLASAYYEPTYENHMSTKKKS